MSEHPCPDIRVLQRISLLVHISRFSCARARHIATFAAVTSSWSETIREYSIPKHDVLLRACDNLPLSWNDSFKVFAFRAFRSLEEVWTSNDWFLDKLLDCRCYCGAQSSADAAAQERSTSWDSLKKIKFGHKGESVVHLAAQNTRHPQVLRNLLHRICISSPPPLTTMRNLLSMTNKSREVPIVVAGLLGNLEIIKILTEYIIQEKEKELVRRSDDDDGDKKYDTDESVEVNSVFFSPCLFAAAQSRSPSSVEIFTYLLDELPRKQLEQHQKISNMKQYLVRNRTAIKLLSFCCSAGDLPLLKYLLNVLQVSEGELGTPALDATTRPPILNSKDDGESHQFICDLNDQRSWSATSRGGRGRNFDPPFIAAIRNKQTHIVDYLLFEHLPRLIEERGLCNVSDLDEFSRTTVLEPMLRFVRDDCFFSECSADFTERKLRYTPLMMACHTQQSHVAKKILDVCQQYNVTLGLRKQRPYRSTTALHIAVSRENFDCVQLLLEHPRSPFFQKPYVVDGWKNSPLHAAVRQLVDAVAKTSTTQYTLTISVLLAIVKTLLEYSTRNCAVGFNRDFNTAFDLLTQDRLGSATPSSPLDIVVHFLREKHADVHGYDLPGNKESMLQQLESAVRYARYQCHLRHLLENNRYMREKILPEVSIRISIALNPPIERLSALHYAAWSGRSQLLLGLIEAGKLDPTTCLDQLEKRWTILHTVVESQSLRGLHAICSAPTLRQDVETMKRMKNSQGETPHDVACRMFRSLTQGTYSNPLTTSATALKISQLLAPP